MISNLSKEQWDQKVIELGGSILQSWNWGKFAESLDEKIYRFSGKDFACLAIETDLPMGKKYLYAPRGPLGSESEALYDLKTMKKNSNLIFARIEPHHTLDLPRAVKDIQPAKNWMLNLEASEVEILAGMKPKTRYNINLAQRKGVRIRQGSKEDLLDLWQLFLQTANRNSFRLHPQNYYLKMYEALADSEIKLLLAEYEGKILAGMILTLFGSTATYLHGGSSEAMKEAMAPYLLHFEAIKLAQSAGMKTYDFGGVSEPGWEGISRFKIGFGGFEVVYPGAFDLIYSPIWYNVYKQARLAQKILRRQ